MRVGATVVLLSGLTGVVIGGFAGYVGGKLDTFVSVDCTGAGGFIFQFSG